MYYFWYVFHFNLTNVILWPVEGWCWAFMMHEFDKAVTVVITFFHHNTNPPLPTICAGNKAVQGDVMYAI
jgi:hypothetical protein